MDIWSYVCCSSLVLNCDLWPSNSGQLKLCLPRDGGGISLLKTRSMRCLLTENTSNNILDRKRFSTSQKSSIQIVVTILKRIWKSRLYELKWSLSLISIKAIYLRRKHNTFYWMLLAWEVSFSSWPSNTLFFTALVHSSWWDKPHTYNNTLPINTLISFDINAYANNARNVTQLCMWHAFCLITTATQYSAATDISHQGFLWFGLVTHQVVSIE